MPDQDKPKRECPRCGTGLADYEDLVPALGEPGVDPHWRGKDVCLSCAISLHDDWTRRYGRRKDQK